MILAFVPLIFLSGCFSFFDEEADGTGVDELTGYKVCYKSDDYTLDDTYALYAEHILTQLYANFGIVSDNKNILADKPLTTESANYDRIRVQVMEDQTITNTGWKWSIPRNTEGAESLTEISSTVEYYASTARQTTYLTTYLDAYKNALEIVCLEIVMNQTPTVFNVSINEANKTVGVFKETQQINVESSMLLNQTRQTFAQTSNYIGMTADDISTLKAYILENIVGSQVLNAYDKVVFSGATKNYGDVIQQILATSPASLTKSILTPYPIASVKDITNTSLYISQGNKPLEHITARNYQSFVFMPSQTVDIMTLLIAFESEVPLSIGVSVNLIQNQTSTQIASYTQNTTGTTVDLSTVEILDIPAGKIDIFDNSGGLSANVERNINNQNGNSIFYGIDLNGSAVLDAQNIHFSCIEVVFNNPSKQPFKFGLQSVLLE